ncbi:MAG: N-acetylmuramoyl-L-alanine amidase [Tannerella sp.]|jgi:N-acetylmuramoyl-L-alanine amidase|nr:N-acetylmuramoyl-L-alanine amidase [Tannerella sp.]
MRLCTLLIFIFSCFGVFVFPKETATPRQGEGVYRFLINNGRDPKIHYDEFIALNKNKLGRNNTLIKGVLYTLPPLEIPDGESVATPSNSNADSGKKRKEPLFGKKYAEYTVNSSRLKGATFYLVSGHGGPDCGAIGIADGQEIHEDEYAYDIMLRLARNLMMEGATVHIIIQDRQDGIRDDTFLKNNQKETCMGREIPLNQKKRLQQRCDVINRLYNNTKDKYRRAIFIHLDSRSTKQQMDVFFYHHEKSAAGKQLANTMRQTFREHYQNHQPGRGFTGTVSTRDLHVLANTQPVSLFAELGNIRNSFDQRRFLPSSNRQALANWICRGFITDYKNSKK